MRIFFSVDFFSDSEKYYINENKSLKKKNFESYFLEFNFFPCIEKWKTHSQTNFFRNWQNLTKSKSIYLKTLLFFLNHFNILTLWIFKVFYSQISKNVLSYRRYYVLLNRFFFFFFFFFFFLNLYTLFTWVEDLRSDHQLTFLLCWRESVLSVISKRDSKILTNFKAKFENFSNFKWKLLSFKDAQKTLSIKIWVLKIDVFPYFRKFYNCQSGFHLY